MNLANIVFYLLLFIGFFLPTNTNMYIPLSGILLKVNELAFLLLPLVNLFCTSNYKRFKIGKKLSNPILLYLVLVLITEFVFKPLFLGQSFGGSFKTFRIGLPLFSSLFLLYSGIRANVKIVWKVLLVAVGISVLLSILSIFINLPIYYEMEGENVLAMFKGRVINSNASFGVIGLYLLFKDKDQWYNQGRLVKIVSVLSVIALIISFNRTYLALLVLEFLYLALKTFSRRTFTKALLYPIIFFGIAFYSYNNFDIVQRQIDKRILSIVFQETSLAESTINDNRDQIYEGIERRIDEGYWVIGLPYNSEIFKMYKLAGGEYRARKTDISIVNILLRYGFLPLLFFLGLLYRIQKKKYVPFIILAIYVLASLNTDALFGQNSILFLILFAYLFLNEKKLQLMSEKNTSIQ